jgi:hypothetical protein
MITPQPMLQHQPTKQKVIVKSCASPTTVFTLAQMSLWPLCSVLDIRGLPMQKRNQPDIIVPLKAIQ